PTSPSTASSPAPRAPTSSTRPAPTSRASSGSATTSRPSSRSRWTTSDPRRFGSSTSVAVACASQQAAPSRPHTRRMTRHMTKNSVLTLRITGPDGTVNEARSEQESIILGSGIGAGVRLLDPQVSNLHVMLMRESDGRVMAIDLGSERGTLLGGERRLTDPTSLRDGDVLQLGGSRVCIHFGEGAAAGTAAVGEAPAP